MGGVAAPVEEEDALFPLLKAVEQELLERVGDDGQLLVFPELTPHVHDLGGGEGAVVDPVVHPDHLVFTDPDIVEGFERGCSGTENDGRIVEFGPVDGEIPAVVTRCFLLLIGGFVLFVDDDEAEVVEGGEDRRTRPDHDPGLAACDAQPTVAPFPFGEVTVPDHDVHPKRFEPGPECADGLRGECDFGNKKEGSGSRLSEHMLKGLDVDLGFSGTGYAVEQDRLK